MHRSAANVGTAFVRSANAKFVKARTLPSRAVRLTRAGTNATDLATALRALTLPVLARVADDAVLLDLRSVEPEDDDALGAALESVAG